MLGRHMGLTTQNRKLIGPNIRWILNPDGSPVPGFSYVWIDNQTWIDANVWKD